jgi:hypothetical protein
MVLAAVNVFESMFFFCFSFFVAADAHCLLERAHWSKRPTCTRRGCVNQGRSGLIDGVEATRSHPMAGSA